MLRGDLRIGRRRLPYNGSPWIMGIVNITPDSFSDGGDYRDAAVATQHALQLVAEGADLLDIGGESSRPGAEPITAEEKTARVLPVLKALRSQVEVPLSVDTTKAAVARAALEHGADMINDISALQFDPQMVEALAASQCSVVLMHMQGEPRTMQDSPAYDDVVQEVGDHLQERCKFAVAHGIEADRLIIDPGIGYGKRLADNMALLRASQSLGELGWPLLIGASRKRFLGEILGEADPLQRLEGDLAVAAWCHANAVHMLRVHEVRPFQRLFTTLNALADDNPGTASADSP